MLSARFWICVALVSFPSWGCAPRQKATVVSPQATYTCASCKDEVTYLYGTWPESPKGIPTGRKVVKHTCTDCKREWSAAVGDTTTCVVCTSAAARCPECMKQVR